MKLTAGRVYDAFIAIAQIVDRPRKLPQTTKYRLARWYAIFKKEYELLEVERTKLIKELGTEVFQDPETKEKSMGWRVEPNTPAFEEYGKRWTDLRAQELDLPVEPLKLMAFGESEEGVESNEFVMLGELVIE